MVEDGRIAEIGDVDVATLDISRVRSTATLLTDAIAAELPPPLERYDEGVWDRLEPDRLRDILRSSVVPEVEAWQRMQLQTRQSTDTAAQVGVQLPRESSMAGLLVHLKENKQFDTLKQIFYKKNTDLTKLLGPVKYRDPLDFIDPKRDIDQPDPVADRCGALVPSVLLRVRHVPRFARGSCLVEPGIDGRTRSRCRLVETLVEKQIETGERETIVKTEKSSSEEDEISGPRSRRRTSSDTKFGMTADVHQGWISGSANASTSLNLDSTQSKRTRAHPSADAPAEREALDGDSPKLQVDLPHGDRDHRHVEQAVRAQQHDRRLDQL